MDKIVRVYDIILDKNHDACKPNCTADDIGTIYFTELDELTPEADKDFELSTAKPYHYNLLHIPVKNELVHIKYSASPKHNELEKPDKYYLSPLSIMQNVNSNAFIDRLNHKNDNYFKLNALIKRLQPYEGDMILQGRFGNSIRFGSTINTEKITRKNNWSNEGQIGSPITIISNGHQTISTNIEEEYEHTVENINQDNSSIWLCSDQQINNFEIASLHDLSYYYDREREKHSEEPEVQNNALSENVKEDPSLSPAEELPPEETQSTELANVQEIETDYYDIASTEAQTISINSNLILSENYVLPDNINDNFLNEEIG